MEPSPLTAAERKAQIVLARHEFWEFCIHYDQDFFERRPFLKDVAAAFMLVHNGKVNRISVSMPPRAGKSYITTLFCAWTLGKRPTESVMRNTCTARLYEKFSYDVRAVVKSAKFKEVFPDVELAEDKQAVNGWNLKTSKQVGYFGAGVGGTIIGFGASALAITDDLYKSYEDAMSDNTNDKVHSWKESAHDSRLERGCPQIDIGTRWTKKDVIGKNTELVRYNESVVISALTSDGKSFCEDVKTTEEYQKIKSEIDPIIWDAEYMQHPTEAKGLLFPSNELNYFHPSQTLADSFESSMGYSDIADEGSDFLASPVGRNVKERIYITDLVFNNLNADVTLTMVADLIIRNKVRYNRVESNSMGAMYARNLQKLVKSCQVLQAVSTTNKHTRILMEAGFIKKYCYFLAPEHQSPEYKSFMNNLCSYDKAGTAKHDDAPDGLTGLTMFIRAMLNKYY